MLTVEDEINGEIISGKLACSKCGTSFPIIGGIPRFVKSELYTRVFGFQWNKYATTQADSVNGSTIYSGRFKNITKWDISQLSERLVLDAGCGPGSFVDVIAGTGAEIVAFDLSNAVDACYKNHGQKKNVHVFQADVYNLPLKKEIFDYLYCIGVIHYTPFPKKTISVLPQYLKKGGKMALWTYIKLPLGLPRPKHILRLYTSRLSVKDGENFVDWYVPKAIKARNFFGGIPIVGKYLKKLIPVADYTGIFELSKEQLNEWALMDTYDMLMPEFEHPMDFRTYRKYLLKNSMMDIKCDKTAGIAVTASKA